MLVAFIFQKKEAPQKRVRFKVLSIYRSLWP